jgi:MFS family permease
MLAAPFTSGVGFYAFYAMQPYLLNLYGNRAAYAVAGLAAAIFAGSQIVGGILAPRIRSLLHRRTSALILGTALGALFLVLLGVAHSFWVALFLLVLWGMSGAAVIPIHQAYLNDLIPSKQRATVLSFDSLMGSSGGVVVQPILGRAADVWGYGTSYVVGAAIQVLAVPFLLRSRAQNAGADTHANSSRPVAD